MTGQYGQLNGVRTLGDKWNPETELNLARILKENGYQTAMFGKWHLGCDPEGFDDYQYLAKEGQGMFGEQGVYFNPSFKDKNNGYVLYEGYVTDIITNLTTNWIKNRKKEQPFFLMCHHKAPHDFWEYAQRHEHMFDDKTIPEPEAIEALLREILEVRLRPGAGSAVYIMISVKRIMLQVRYREQST